MPELMPHQLSAAGFLAERKFAILADDMGLGKTASAVAAADLARARKILVFCPAVVRPHWAREFARFQTIEREIVLVDGYPKSPPTQSVTILSHASLADWKALTQINQGAPYDLIIADEWHTFRSWDAKRTENFLTPNSGVFTWARQVWGLTGTPIVNSAADLWPTFAGPMGRVVDWWTFCKEYTEIRQGSDGPKPTGVKNTAMLASLLRPVMLRRTLESVGIELPPLEVYQKQIPVPQALLTQVTAELGSWSETRLLRALEMNDDLKDQALARVRQALGLAKVEAMVVEAQSWVKPGQPLVIFFYHTKVREELYARLTALGYIVSWIDGKISPKELEAAEGWFQRGDIDILLVQIQAGGQGITLHRAFTCLICELPWTAVAIQQAVKRIHRIGQKYLCGAIILRAQGCWLEDILANVVTRKEKASEELLSLLTVGN